MYIPTVVLPTFASLRQRGGSPDIWGAEDGHVRRLFPRGSQAFAAVAKAAVSGRAPICFVPAYFCNGSLEPLRATGAKIVFYRSGPDFSPDWEDVLRLARAQRPDVFMLVHYFGKAQPRRQAVDFCRESGCLLLDDAAHILEPVHELGQQGAVAMYCPHKLLALPPISICLVPIEIARKLDEPARVAIRRDDCVWLAKRLMQKGVVAFGELGPRASAKTDSSNAAGAIVAAPLATSFFSELLLGIEQRTVVAAARTRRDNFRFLADVILRCRTARLVKPYDEWSGSGAPYLLPVQVLGDIEGAYNRFWQLGIPVQRWPDLAPEVLGESQRYSDELRRRAGILFLPVHQSLHRAQVDVIGKALQSVFA